MKNEALAGYLSELSPDCELAESTWTKADVEEMMNKQLTDQHWSRCVALWDDTPREDEWYWIIASVTGEQ